jgi:hypothetical protein
MRRQRILAGFACAGALAVPAPAGAAQHAGPLTSSGPGFEPAAVRAMKYGPLPADAGRLAAQKRVADRAVQRASRPRLFSRLLSPVAQRSWQGIDDQGGTPSDSTGAIGPSRYVELVNSKFAVYDRTTDTPLGSGTLQSLVGAPAGNQVFDPQIIWDNSTSRFYYAADWVVNPNSDNRIAWGFSKTNAPTSAADWCHYYQGYQRTFPDFPKLGDTAGFIFVGVNKFDVFSKYVGSDVFAASKPPNGTITTCPPRSSLVRTIARNLKTPAGQDMFTPVPANQIDNSNTGFVIGRNKALPSTRLWQLQLGKNANGTPIIPLVASPIVVPAYSVPSNAPSPGFAQRIDTADARNTQAILSYDPTRGTSKFGLWTQHTVNGGAGARVRWYEINPVSRTLYQTGVVAPAGLFAFNASISSDRQVRGATKRFGANMVINFNTSSSSAPPAINVVSKIGAGPVSAPTVIKTSLGGYADFHCPLPADTCRWGDYSAASPDPALPPTETVGQIWGTNQWNLVGNTAGTPWRTWNFAVRP